MKKVKLSIKDGASAYCIFKAFKRQAKIEGWTESEINEVIDDAKVWDYNHLFTTINDRCE